MKVKFWGTRGLISSPSKDTAIYGGNTTCMQIINKSNIIIVDTGFGACNLGEELMSSILSGGEALNIHIFYTHFHWDHIQGLPFFHPIYFETSTINIYSPLPVNVAHGNLNLLFDGSYSPFSGIDSMASKININHFTQPVEIDDIVVDHIELDHGQDFSKTRQPHAFGLKFFNKADKSTVVIATDHEARDGKLNDALIDFAKNSDILIHDAQFTEQDYTSRVGWGHSTIQQALSNGIKSNAKRILLTHHHPSRTDNEIIKFTDEIKNSQEFSKLNFEFAKEKMIYSPVKKASK